MLTGDEEYLNPYQAALKVLDERVRELGELVADNEEQQKAIPRLKELLAQKVQHLREGIELRRREGAATAAAVVKAGNGLEMMQQIREVVSEMRHRELDLLDARTAASQQSFRRARLSTVFSALLGVSAVGAFVWLLRRHLVSLLEGTAAVNQQRELLRATLASIGDAVIATDARGKVSFLNRVAERLTGWSQADAVGQPLDVVFQIVNEETREPVENPAVRALREGRIMGLANHTILVAKDGQEWPIDDSAGPIMSGASAVGGAILVFREIRERKQHEQQMLRQAEALQEADRRKDEFLATLAHELRNPLSPLSNALQLWPMIENDKDEMERMREMMERQVQQMIRLIDDLMDVSRITRGKIELHKQAVDLGTLVAGSVEAIQPLIDCAATA